MTHLQIVEAVDDRIGKDSRWGQRFVESSGTPLICIGVGFGENLGRLVVTCIEELANEDIRFLCQRLLADLEGGAR